MPEAEVDAVLSNIMHLFNPHGAGFPVDGDLGILFHAENKVVRLVLATSNPFLRRSLPSHHPLGFLDPLGGVLPETCLHRLCHYAGNVQGGNFCIELVSGRIHGFMMKWDWFRIDVGLPGLLQDWFKLLFFGA